MPEPGRPARAVFSSSTLLTEIMQRPLDPGYAVAHRRRQEQRAAADGGPVGGGRADDPPAAAPPPRDRPGWGRLLRERSLVIVVVGVLLGLATGAGVAELRSAPLDSRDRAVLEAEIERRTEVADALAESNVQLRDEIEAQQEAALAEGSTSVLAAADRLAVPVGAAPVVGDGVVVVMDDAPDAATEGGFADDGRVRDGDLQTVVNGLWGAGAEAVSVNGQRLTALSTIRFAGAAIVVDLRPLARPYTVEAVGDPDALLAELRRGRTADYAQALRNNYAITVQEERAEDLRLPAASRLTLRHAAVVDPSPPADVVGEDGQS